jgi:hypothetical protein
MIKHEHDSTPQEHNYSFRNTNDFAISFLEKELEFDFHDTRA